MKKKKISIVWLIIIVIASNAFVLYVLNRILCPTYYKYPDFMIRNMRQGEIEETFGEFDIEHNLFGAYYIYTDSNGERQYYIIYFNEPGGYTENIVVDSKIMHNPYRYFYHGEEPEYITQEFYMYLFWKNLRAHTYRDVGPLCDYFQITEEEFMKDALAYVAEMFQEYPHIRENAVEQLGDYTAWQDEIYEFGNMLFNNNEIMDIEDICEENGLTEDLFYKGLMLEAEEICEQHQYTGDY